MISGKSIAASTFPMIDITKKIDDMEKFLKLETFKERANLIHGGKYSYELVNHSNYHGRASIIPIICPIHGTFEQIVDKHLIGHGCRKCSILKKRKLIYGVAINDFEPENVWDDITKRAYKRWLLMLTRCYSDSFHKKYPTYKGCEVCDEWLKFSNYKMWFDKNYAKGYQLDKDILVKGNKVYSPDTCCFVPQRINSLFTKPNKSIRKGITLGVHKRGNGNYQANITINTKGVCLGTYMTENEAINAYKQAKEKFIQEMATKYYKDGRIAEKVYNALMNYKVEITD